MGDPSERWLVVECPTTGRQGFGAADNPAHDDERRKEAAERGWRLLYAIRIRRKDRK